MINIKEEHKVYGTYTIVTALVIALIFSLWGNISKKIKIENKDTLMEQMAKSAEDEKVVLEKRLESSDKLTQYEEERTILKQLGEENKEFISLLKNELKSAEEAGRLNASLTNDKEKQIRCQRAVVTKIEDRDCDESDTFEYYGNSHP